MATVLLTLHRADTVNSDRKTCDIPNRDFRGFGVRILPSGRKRCFVRSLVDG
ncbi:MAG: hypothetical protein OXI95_11490 [bacterium]|nr:hypothetical protein [bacterium]MDE0417544.1 hypothetical protein [bacterium]